MTDEEKKRIADMVAKRVCDYYSYEGCKYKHIIKALDRIDKTGAYKNFFERRLKYREEIELDSDKLISKNIDDSINYLLNLKKDGWIGIAEEWSGYESNYFVAYRYIKEPDNVYEARICKLIEEYVVGILREETRLKEKKKELEKVKKELEDLIKNEL